MKLILIISISLLCQPLLAQDKIVENIIPSGDDDLNYEDLYENISQLTSNPLDLNTTTVESLLSLGILSPRQANDIINYRNENGDLLEIYELQSIQSLDLSTINGLRPFVTVRSSVPGKKFIDRVRSQQNTYFLTRYERTIERARGYLSTTDSSSRYRGDPGRIYSRFRTNSPGDLSIGLTAEKDAGERMGFDFYSAHVQVMNKGPVANLIIGDYTAQFGQGLTIGGGFGIGKGSETITTLRRSSTGFMPYTSANEAGFFRGSAISFSLPACIIVHAFASSLPRDASSSDEGSLAVLQSGKHRTPTEFYNRHRMREKNFGSVIEYKGQSLQTGLIVHRTDFTQPINKSPAIYNGFDFRGTSSTNIGAFASYNLQNLAFFGEASQTINGGRGWIAGVLGSLSRNFDMSLLLRHYDRDYITFYSNAISENTAPKNESGIYWGLKHSITRKLSYTAYADIFTFPWLRFRSYQPSNGNETLVRITYKHSKTVDCFIQFRDERKVRNAPAEGQSYQSAPVTRRNWIVGSSFTYGKLSLRSRIQWSSFRQTATTRGFAMAFDAAYEWNRFSFASRFAVFDTDDFDNRQYMNERDVLMAFSFPAYYGEGTRMYLVGRYQPARWLDLWVKVAETNYFNQEGSGSGGDTIAGNKRHDVKIEVVFRMS
jgi:hypothetical protein